jgi:branched-chain amino acid transport system ATP-binding protein
MLQLHNIYRQVGGNHILNGIDLKVFQGQAIGLVGPNGCGKTSLLNIINGFYYPTQGSVIVDEKHITTLSVEARGQMGIGRVFQTFGIFKTLTLYENLALAFVNKLSRRYKLLPLRYLPKEYKQQIHDILQELNLWNKKDELAGNLSGGQMRLLEIARLYLQDTQIYLLDEPTAGVSPKFKEKVIELINKIIAKQKIVIIVEHDFEFLAQFVDTFLVMNDGKVVLEGPYATVRNNPMIKEIYFGKDRVEREEHLLERAELIKESV